MAKKIAYIISLLALIAILVIIKAVGADDSTKMPIPPTTAQKIVCKASFGPEVGTVGREGPYGGSVRAWETNYDATDNGAVSCPDGYVLTKIVSWHHNDGAHYMSDIYGGCRQLTISCDWGAV